MELKPFGNIDVNNLEDYYSSEVKVGDKNIEVDLNFENESIKEKDLINIPPFIENIEEHLTNAMKSISEDYDLGDDSETVQDYLSHHQEILDDEELQELFGTKTISKELFLSKLETHRIGFYPEDDESFVIIDIQFPQEITDYILAVTLDSEFNLSYISMDS